MGTSGAISIPSRRSVDPEFQRLQPAERDVAMPALARSRPRAGRSGSGRAVRAARSAPRAASAPRPRRSGCRGRRPSGGFGARVMSSVSGSGNCAGSRLAAPMSDEHRVALRGSRLPPNVMSSVASAAVALHRAVVAQQLLDGGRHQRRARRAAARAGRDCAAAPAGRCRSGSRSSRGRRTAARCRSRRSRPPSAARPRRARRGC